MDDRELMRTSSEGDIEVVIVQERQGDQPHPVIAIDAAPHHREAIVRLSPVVFGPDVPFLHLFGDNTYQQEVFIHRYMKWAAEGQIEGVEELLDIQIREFDARLKYQGHTGILETSVIFGAFKDFVLAGIDENDQAALLQTKRMFELIKLFYLHSALLPMYELSICGISLNEYTNALRMPRQGEIAFLANGTIDVRDFRAFIRDLSHANTHIPDPFVAEHDAFSRGFGPDALDPTNARKVRSYILAMNILAIADSVDIDVKVRQYLQDRVAAISPFPLNIRKLGNTEKLSEKEIGFIHGIQAKLEEYCLSLAEAIGYADLPSAKEGLSKWLMDNWILYRVTQQQQYVVVILQNTTDPQERSRLQYVFDQLNALRNDEDLRRMARQVVLQYMAAAN